MKEFIKIIESIGFNYGLDNIMYNTLIGNDGCYYTYNNWVIFIQDKHWELRYQHSKTGVSVAHTRIPFDDRKILNKYFKAQLRESKLNELGIIN